MKIFRKNDNFWKNENFWKKVNFCKKDIFGNQIFSCVFECHFHRENIFQKRYYYFKMIRVYLCTCSCIHSVLTFKCFIQFQILENSRFFLKIGLEKIFFWLSYNHKFLWMYCVSYIQYACHELVYIGWDLHKIKLLNQVVGLWNNTTS